MTVRLAAPMTAIGLPRSSGLDCCSTEAKKAFMSMWRMMRIPTLTRLDTLKRPVLIGSVVAQFEAVGAVGDGKMEQGGVASPDLPKIGKLPDRMFLPAPLKPDRLDATTGGKDGGYPDPFRYYLHSYLLQLPVD